MSNFISRWWVRKQKNDALVYNALHADENNSFSLGDVSDDCLLQLSKDIYRIELLGSSVRLPTRIATCIFKVILYKEISNRPMLDGIKARIKC